MIKIASIALMPVVFAAFYTHESRQNPISTAMPGAQIEEQDRQFLASLAQPVSTKESDRDFLAKLQTEESQAVPAEMPVRRAIPVERAVPMARMSAPVVIRDLAEDATEVRRAAAVVRTSSVSSASVSPRARTMTSTVTASPSSSSADLRHSLQESYATMDAPEIRRAATVGGEGRRASIVIFGDQVVLR